jgi:hypothetical protein
MTRARFKRLDTLEVNGRGWVYEVWQEVEDTPGHFAQVYRAACPARSGTLTREAVEAQPLAGFRVFVVYGTVNPEAVATAVGALGGGA